MEDKNIKNVEVNEEKELKEDEVNGYCSCTTHLKVHCNHDCLDGTAWLSTAN